MGRGGRGVQGYFRLARGQLNYFIKKFRRGLVF